MKARFLLPLGLILLCSFAFIQAANAQGIIPSSKRVIWEGNVGVAGDIPNRTIICTTINNATYGNGITDATNAIQTALNNCPSNQVVYLPPGTYNTTGTITIPSNVTLRGAGMGVTIIRNSVYVIYLAGFYNNPDFNFYQSTARDIIAGNIKGSMSITTSSPHGWNAGDIILIDQLEDPTGDPPITSTGSEDTCTWCSRNSGTRPAGQLGKVISVPNSTTAILELSLNKNYDKSPQAIKLSGITSNAGVEDLTLNSSIACPNDNYGSFSDMYSDNSWLLNVEISNVCRTGLSMYSTYRNTIRGCSIHDTSHHTSNGGYMISLWVAGSGDLIEDNIMYNGLTGIVYEGASSGNVFAYNYITRMWNSNYPYAAWPGIAAHGPYPMMNLLEGNYLDGVTVWSDFIHGSSGSNNAYLRNRQITNRSFSQSPLNEIYGIEFATDAWYMNMVGNVLGTSGYETVYQGTDLFDSQRGIYYLQDSGVNNSILRHGNWDSVHNGVLWDPTISDHNIPFSLYLSSKPSWFGSVPWPPIGSDIAGLSNKIPAQLRYEGNYSYLSAQNCSSLKGTPCSTGQICSGGSFVYSSDYGNLCCVGGTCQASPCGNGNCDSGECNYCPKDCTLAQCHGNGQCDSGLRDGYENCQTDLADCLSGNNLCCSGIPYSGNCCYDSDCTSPKTCINHVCTQLCDNLVLLMHFDNQVQYGESPTHIYDFSGNGNNGTVTGATWSSSGKFSGAFTYDGINDLINVSIVSGSLDIDSNPVTMVAWIKPNTVTTQQAIVARGRSDGVTLGWDGFGFWINSSGRINVGSFGGGNFDGNTILTANTWYHVAVVINGASTTLYLNGLDSTPASHTVNVAASNLSLKIGTARNSSDTADMRFFSGTIDELAIWNRSLSSQEIQNLYSSGSPITCGNCIHKSDNNPCDGCVDMTELSAFINRWNINNLDVTMKELIEAIGLWNGGCS